jgi:hypothetical protein
MNAGQDRDFAILGAGVTPYDVKMRDALAAWPDAAFITEEKLDGATAGS